MKFYSLKTLPYDLANTSAFFTLSHLIKLLAETNPAIAIIAVVGEVRKHLDVVKPLLDSVNFASHLAKFIDISRKVFFGFKTRLKQVALFMCRPN